MKPTQPQTPLNDLPTFLAYSLLLELESAERLRELAEAMAQHHKPDIEQLLLQLAGYSDKHGAEVQGIVQSACGDTPLPDLKPWDFEWPGAEPPETFDYAALRYEMSPRQLLEVALALEHNTADFYADIARRSVDENIRLHADNFATEELSHAEALEQWLRRLPPEEHRNFDIDPAHQPE